MNSASINQAFEHAAGMAKTKGGAKRVRAAQMAWSSTPTSGAVAHMRSAIQAAERNGVGALFLTAVGDVAEADALEAAEVKNEAPATEEDQSYVDWVMANVRAMPHAASEIVQTMNSYSPSVIASEAATSAAKSYVDSASEATTNTIAAARDAAAATAHAAAAAYQEAKATAKDTADKVMKLSSIMAIAAAFTGGAFLLYMIKK